MGFPKGTTPSGMAIEVISLPVTNGPDYTPGDDVNGNSAGDWAMSEDGRWVLFASRGALDGTDTNGERDAFLADRATGRIERISVAPNGAQIPEGNFVSGDDDDLGISPDGRYALFATFDGGTGLVPDSPAARGFVYDRVTGTLSAAPSDRMDHLDVDGAGVFAYRNADGAYAFDPASGETTLLVDDPRNRYDIAQPDVSVDGEVVAYTAWSFDGGVGFGSDLRLRLADGTVIVPGRPADGSIEGGFSFWPSLSDDGNLLVFQSRDPRLVEGGDVDGTGYDVFLYDVAAGAITQISRTADGSDANGDSYQPTISNDGRYVAFTSNGSNLPDAVGSSHHSAYVFDRQTGRLVRVDDDDVASRDVYSNHAEPVPSGFVVFGSIKSLVPEDTNNAHDVYVTDLRFSDGDDRVRLEPWGETVFALGGNDLVRAGGGGQTIFGGDGRDRLAGGRGRDDLHGEDGRDRLLGGAGDDLLSGGRGGDQLVGGAGEDTASYADAARGVTASLAVPDRNTGEAAGDVYEDVENLRGSRKRDRLEGDGGDNALAGGGGGDAMSGGRGDDRLSGEGGDDILDGRLGDDVLAGGAGADVFLYGRRGGDDVIADFEPGTDTVDLSELGLSARQLLRSASQGPDGVTGDFGRHGSLTLEAVSFADLSAGDFII